MKIKGIIFTNLILFCTATGIIFNTDIYGQKDSIKDKPLFAEGNGISIVSKDSLYKVDFGFRIQNRVDINTESLSDFTVQNISAQVRRFRLKFDGFVYDPNLTYKIELSLSGRDLGNTPGRVPHVIRDAVIKYRFNKFFQISFGQNKLPGNLERLVSSGDLQLVDRSIVNSLLNIDRDIGFQGKYTINPNSDRLLILQGAITTGEGMNRVLEVNNGLSYTSRIEYYPLGKFKSDGAYFEGDLLVEESPKLMAGIVFNYNASAYQNGGQRGIDLYEERNIRHWMADVILKYSGWAIQSEFIKRFSNDPITTSPDVSDIVYVYNGQGFTIQASKYFPSSWEVTGRFSTVDPLGEVEVFEPQQRQWTIGISRYLRDHNLKIQSDLSLNERIMPSGEENNNWALRFQVELGI
ncbi:porin [Membranihabitans maritimus]|uniref:porin n=1 Tax=Membranihabitans maritimus TaxID=2904244 RepID=UPI001F2333CE|nr:porin [Membranihabitans maritimus]